LGGNSINHCEKKSDMNMCLIPNGCQTKLGCFFVRLDEERS